MRRIVPGVFILAACLLLAACDGRRQQTEAELRAQVESWREKYESALSKDEALAEQLEAARTEAEAHRKEMERLRTRAAELPELRQQVQALQNRIGQLQEEATEERDQPSAPPSGSSEQALPLERIRDRLRQVGRDLFRRGDCNAAQPVLLSANQLGAEDPLTLYQMAYCEAVFGRHARAAEHYAACRDALQTGPTVDAELLKKCLLNHGVTLSRLGKREEAAALYQQAIALDESYAPPYFNLGLLYAEEPGKHEEAIEALRNHIAHGGTRSVSARNVIRDLQQDTE